MRHDLFSTPLWHIEGTPQQLVEELYQGAYGFKEKYPSENRSGQGGYQTPTLSWEDFHPQGKEYVDSVVGNIFENFKVKEWWYNISGKGNWNSPHTHPYCDYALVFYVTDSDDLLRLMNPRKEDKETYVGINANKGDILIFPSDIQHFVMPNPREEDRISISMNLQLC